MSHQLVAELESFPIELVEVRAVFKTLHLKNLRLADEM
jgi:hypothetical protein